MSEQENRDAGEDEDWPEALSRRERELVEKLESSLGKHRDDLERRHWIQALAALGLLGAGSRELYRRDLLGALPEVRYSARSDAEPWEATWHPNPDTLSDGLSSGGGFAALLLLASVGSQGRSRDQPVLSLATAGMSLFQAATSAQRLVAQLQSGDVDAFASIETILSASTVPLAVPEAVRAVRGMLFGD